LTPTSFDQSRAINPVPEAIIITTKTMTMASDTMPTLSDLRRFQASAHNPGETVCGISRAARAGAFNAMSFAMTVSFT